MSDSITLTLRDAPAGRVVADAIVPDRLATLSADEIARLPIWIARRATREAQRGETQSVANVSADRHTVALGDLFAVRGERAAEVRVVGNLSAMEGIGAGMTAGTLTIDGGVGRELGRGMTGGTIAVHGSAGAGAGLAMAGGSIWISGHAGDGVGGALPGASRGMTGGEIIVRRNVGRDAGSAARRGLIVVGGDADDGAARSMIAGTVMVFGKVVGSVGLWNKRGSVISLGGAAIPPTYQFACTYRPPFVRLLLAYLRRAHGVPVDDRFLRGRYARYCGDLSELGRGEILILKEP